MATMRRENAHRDDVVGAALRRLPVPPGSPQFFRELERRLAAQSLVRERSWLKRADHLGWMPTWLRPAAALVTTAVVSALAGGFIAAWAYAKSADGGPVVSSFEPSVTSFEPVEGWNTVVTTIDPKIPSLPIVWAANVPFAAEEFTTGFPTNTVKTLPPEGIVITVIGPREYTGGEFFPPAEFPLEVSDGFCNFEEYEGQPAPNVSMCLIDTMVGDQLLNITVWFGTTSPSESDYSAANEQLARLVVPS